MKGSRYQKSLAAVLLLAAPFLTRVALADSSKNEVRVRAQLTGSAIGAMTPSGHADFRSDSRGRTRFNVEVQHVNLPEGTMLSVTLTRAGVTTSVGQLKLNAFGAGELELNSQDGDSVPAAQSGDVVTVMNGAAAVLSGVL